MAAEVLGRRRDDRRPFLVGIAGAVAVGKSTFAAGLADALAPMRVAVVATDGFLRTNEELAARGLLMQKGFPASYDDGLLTAFLDDLASGRDAVAPAYSHVTYDRAPGAGTSVDAGHDVVVLEGVNALQPAVARRLDLRVFLDAPEPVIRRWYVDRFLAQIACAEHDDGSFYRRFVALDAEQRAQLAEATWTGINLVNLVEHIDATRAEADVVVAKAADHSFE